MDIKVVNKYLIENYPALYLAINHHRTHKNTKLTFVNFPYLIDIYKDRAKKKVLMKSTQSGITEWLIIVAIVKAYYQKRNIFYVMPTSKLKNQVVNTRINQSIQYTPFYRSMLKESVYDNMSVKQIGSASIFFAVSNSKSNFTSFPADDLIIDELDECNFENLEMAPERLAFSSDPQEIRVANPTYPGIGIDFEYQLSDKKNWHITCKCGHEFIPDFFNNIVRQEGEDEFIIRDKNFDLTSDKDANLICDKCDAPVYRYEKGRWINLAKSPVSGRHLNQIFSSRKKLRDMIAQFNLALNSAPKMQRFYNGTLGLPFIGTGMQITDEIINSCKADYLLPNSCKEPCVIGIDVGKKMHTTIFKIIKNADQYKMQLVFAGELFFTVTKEKIDISELTYLYRRYNIVAGIIDARPEDRLARLICQNFRSMWRCVYLSENPKDQVDQESKIYKTDRTSSMDGVKEQLTLANIILPANINSIPGFTEHLKAPVRVFEERETTNGKWVWREGHKDDHYFHAVNYANISKKLILNT